LAGVGIFGVFAGDVTTRRKEIGIRLALGARGSAIVVMLLRQSLARTASGIVAGALLAAALGHGMQSLLFGVGATDPLSFVAVAMAVTALAAAATVAPALQALKRTPLATLREG
jgi:putative ABC transport system permease protein